MDQRQFEINRRIFAKKSSLAILLGSLISSWIYIIGNYLETIKSQGYYSSPFSILEFQLLCLPFFAYQLPAYLVSGMIGISLVKHRWIKPAITAYLGVGITSWVVSALLLSVLFTTNGDYFIAMKIALIGGLPSLLLYLWFLYPKPVG